ncbi:unnamed protein product [Paramecium sonneborni]|uniref:Yippee domain-containing protein n=1 Tax=Paramecium sonneborni TaxID=65129 RepID=A0A8S1LDE9_9CILI|nr:unnamed protein product [Paramecium sonneborni]
MGRPILEYLDGNRIYVCKKCRVHLTNYQKRISKNFKGGTGQAYLFDQGYGLVQNKYKLSCWVALRQRLINWQIYSSRLNMQWLR